MVRVTPRETMSHNAVSLGLRRGFLEIPGSQSRQNDLKIANSSLVCQTEICFKAHEISAKRKVEGAFKGPPWRGYIYPGHSIGSIGILRMTYCEAI